MQSAVLTATAAPRQVAEADTDDLASGVPSPFPRSILALQTNQGSIHLPSTRVASSSTDGRPSSMIKESKRLSTKAERPSTAKSMASTVRFAEPAVTELQSSLESLRESCLNVIINLIPTVPPSALTVSRADRRHSAPVPAANSPILDFDSFSRPDTSQQGLAEYVLSRGDEYMPALLRERLASFLKDISSDFITKQLVEALLSLIMKIDKLPVGRPRPSSALPTPTALEDVGDPFESLGKRVLTVQSRRSFHLLSGTSTPVGNPHGLSADDEDRLWWSIDNDLDVILQICRRRAPAKSPPPDPDADDTDVRIPTPDLQEIEDRRKSSSSSNYFDHFPPEYDIGDYSGPTNELPEYEYDGEKETLISDDEMYGLRSALKPKADRQRATREFLSSPTLQTSSEKMRMDLESVTSAIDRLYEVAPQLHDQRVELKEPKVAEMESARQTARLSDIDLALEAEGSKLVGRGRIVSQTAQPSKRWSIGSLSGKNKATADVKGKGKAREQMEEMPESVRRKGHDLDRMLALIGKSSSEERRIANQRVEIGDYASRLEKVKMREEEKKEQLAEQILKHSGAGRLRSQDATLPRSSILSRTSDPSMETELSMSLPEFMNETPPPASLSRTLDPNALISLPEFFLEQDSHRLSKEKRGSSSRKSSSYLQPSMRGLTMLRSRTDDLGTAAALAAAANPRVALVRRLTRARSNSAPSTGWLGTDSCQDSDSSASEMQSNSLSGRSVLMVSFVAEYQQNLHTVQVYLRLQYPTQGRPLEFEVVTVDDDDSSLTGSDIFVVRMGDSQSPQFSLPVPVLPGLQDIKAYGDHFEVKLAVPPLAQIPAIPSSNEISSPYQHLLDSAQISSIRPTSFVCASCSQHVIACEKVARYVDLPSEHWTELMDAWMCHAEQKLTDAVVKTAGGGFWPKDGTMLVGGRYLLVDEANIVEQTLQRSEKDLGIGDKSSIRCLCGALIGHSEKATMDASTTYRLAKYAVRPVSPYTEPVKIPLCAFVVADMVELQQAHATHRFIIRDEEEDRPRILIWLFNPSIKLSFTDSAHQRAVPHHTTTMTAAKVLFSLVPPSSPLFTNPEKISAQFPAFKNAESLSYPIDVCRRLAATLKESNEAYPSGRRVITQLAVGWLQRL